MRPVQYFTDEYLQQCSQSSPDDVLVFLENFRKLQQPARARSKLISMKVPHELLESFRAKCDIEGIKYQTQIKKLMREWLR